MEHPDPPGDVPRETGQLPTSPDPVGDERNTRFDRLSTWLDQPISPLQRSSLVRFEAWLIEEAAAAGGIGPEEFRRVFDRHIADSMAFLRGLAGPGEPSGRLLDVGSGVGLPGIPIAILRPETEVTLLDRSGRRAALAQRAVRILDLANVAVLHRDIGDVTEDFDALVFRASLGITRASEVFLARSTPDGVGLVGVSRQESPPNIPRTADGVACELSAEGVGVLDSPFWLLRMHRI